MQIFEKRVFQQNLGQNMPKNAYFLEKRLLNRRSVGGSAPEPRWPPSPSPPLAVLGWLRPSFEFFYNQLKNPQFG